MLSKSDGATALQPELVRALSFSVETADIGGPDGPEPTLAALVGVWNGRKGTVAALLRRMRSRQVERYVYSNPIGSEAELGPAVEESLGFLEGLGFQMDSADFPDLSADLRQRRVALWNRLRKPRRRRLARQSQARDDTGVAPEVQTGDDTGVTPEVQTGDDTGVTPEVQADDDTGVAQQPEALPEGALEPDTPCDVVMEVQRKTDLAPEALAELEAGAEAEPEDTPSEALVAQVVAASEATSAPAGRAVVGRVSLVRKGAEPSKPDAIVRLLSLF